MGTLGSIFELRTMLRELERDMGFDGLNRTERDVILAAHSLSRRPGDIVSSDVLRSHTLLEPVAQATFYRAVGKLVGLGLLVRAENTKAKSYVLRRDLFDSGQANP
ncbi:hypothetical protein [Oceaniglobus roseus]|uniref:hypothetical protein n=1 Tax=Oceaniglobus roseus TaxID=1737570 RepID=UPI000C7EA8E2|nr:hypothetical protein [Kandeliimicrobium roseum]